MKPNRFCSAVVVFWVAALVPPTVQPASIDFHELNMTMADDFIVPAYRDLAGSAGALEDTARAFCASPDDDGLDSLRQAFHALMDRWQAVQHVGVGPVTFEMRRYRMQLWPDKRGNVGRHLRDLLESGDLTVLEPAEFGRGSVAVQGLSALEQLLYDDEVVFPDRFGGSEAGAFRCAVVTAIAANLGKATAQIAEGWTVGNGAHLRVFESAPHGNAFYQSAEDLSAMLLRDIRMQLQLVAEYKLARVIGETSERARPRRAESWRSERSLDNIRINLESVRKAWRSGFSRAVTSDELRDVVEADFDEALRTLAGIERPLLDGLEAEAERDRLIDLLDAVNVLVSRFVGDVPANLDLNAGMVSLDGD